jgi:hypothetical protein
LLVLQSRNPLCRSEVEYPSESLEGKVSVQSQYSLPPEEDEGRLVHDLDALIDQLDCVPKGTNLFNIQEGYLRFRSLQSLGIEVLLFEIVEEKLNWCCCVRILARENRAHS